MTVKWKGLIWTNPKMTSDAGNGPMYDPEILCIMTCLASADENLEESVDNTDLTSYTKLSLFFHQWKRCNWKVLKFTDWVRIFLFVGGINFVTLKMFIQCRSLLQELGSRENQRKTSWRRAYFKEREKGNKSELLITDCRAFLVTLIRLKS